MKSYYMPHGPERSGCVDAPLRRGYALNSVGDLASIAGSRSFVGDIGSVLVSTSGAHVAVVWQRLFAVRPSPWAASGYTTGIGDEEIAVWFTSLGFRVGNVEHFPSGERLWPPTPWMPPGRLFFAEVAGDVLISAAQAPSLFFHHPDPGEPSNLPPFVGVTANRLAQNAAGERTAEHLWSVGDHENLVGEGTAVLTEDHRVAVAMQDGTFVILDGITGARLVDRKLARKPFELARIRDTFVTLAKRIDGSGGTDVTSLDDHGGERWTAAIDLTAEHPPVRGGDGQVHVFGNGWVTLDDTGNIVAKSPDATRARGTSFASGALAIATGTALDIYRPNGSRLAHLFAGAPFATPPAIDPNGKIYIATETTLYVAE